MRRRLLIRSLLFAAALPCGCHRPPRAIAVAPAPMQTPQSDRARGAPPVERAHRSQIETRCAEVSGRAMRLIDEAMRTNRACSPRVRARLHESFARCEPAAGGAWATLVTSFEPPSTQDDDCFVAGTWRVAFVAPDGRWIEAPAGAGGALLGPQSFTLGSNEGDGTALSLAIGDDLDGDGRAELDLVVVEGSLLGGAHTQTERHAVLSARGDGLIEYAPPPASISPKRTKP